MSTRLQYTKADFRKFVALQPAKKGFAMTRSEYGIVYIKFHLFNRFVRFFSAPVGRINTSDKKYHSSLSYNMGDCWGTALFTADQFFINSDGEDVSWFCSMTDFVNKRLFPYHRAQLPIRRRNRVITYDVLRKLLIDFEKHEFLRCSDTDVLSGFDA